MALWQAARKDKMAITLATLKKQTHKSITYRHKTTKESIMQSYNPRKPTKAKT